MHYKFNYIMTNNHTLVFQIFVRLGKKIIHIALEIENNRILGNFFANVTVIKGRRSN